MKLREILYTLGLKPGLRTYGFEVTTQDLGHRGQTRFAHWLHPKAQHHRVEAGAIDALAEFIEPGDFCVDIGAHSGDTSVPMAIAAGPTGCVLAMEPNRHLFPVLEENARLTAQRGRIEPVCAAATAEPGTYTFGYDDPGYCNGGDSESQAWWRRRRQFPLEVEGLNLDTLLRTRYADRLDRWKYLKTDTEGNDLAVLKSVAGLLAEYRPYLRVEVYRRSPLDYRAELYDLIADLGYAIHAMPSDCNLRGEPLTAEAVMAIEHDDIFCVPREAAAKKVA
ncbi:MAG: FkbM family methyltransferase [Planctomycetota bacterium]